MSQQMPSERCTAILIHGGVAAVPLPAPMPISAQRQSQPKALAAVLPTCFSMQVATTNATCYALVSTLRSSSLCQNPSAYCGLGTLQREPICAEHHRISWSHRCSQMRDSFLTWRLAAIHWHASFLPSYVQRPRFQPHPLLHSLFHSRRRHAPHDPPCKPCSHMTSCTRSRIDPENHVSGDSAIPHFVRAPVSPAAAPHTRPGKQP